MMKPDMEIGTPALSDPRETILPPDSEPATPQTSSTILTIPSPIPGERITPNAKLAEPIPRTAVIEASDVPLPPSPPQAKQALPFRRPSVSNPLSRVVSDTVRSPSGTGSGRRVSSALQYAMHPQLSPGPEAKGSNRVVSDATSTSIDMDLAYYEQMKDEISSDSGSEEEPEGGADRPAWDSALGFGGQRPDFQGGEGEGSASLTGQEEDEAWMGYVRQQLNTLFPDYFEADAMSQRITGLSGADEEGADGDRDVSVSTVATTELPMPVARFGLSGVPNVRTEIGGLKDEIARLRSVVSDLAEDMRGPRPDVVTSGRGASVGTAGLEGTTQDQLPREFVEVGRGQRFVR